MTQGTFKGSGFSSSGSGVLEAWLLSLSPSVTTQLRESAFDALNIRASGLFFILGREVWVRQPGQIAQGKFHFLFVGPLLSSAW